MVCLVGIVMLLRSALRTITRLARARKVLPTPCRPEHHKDAVRSHVFALFWRASCVTEICGERREESVKNGKAEAR